MFFHPLNSGRTQISKSGLNGFVFHLLPKGKSARNCKKVSETNKKSLFERIPATKVAAARGDPFSRRNSCLDNRPQAGLGINLAIMVNQAAVEVVSNRA